MIALLSRNYKKKKLLRKFVPGNRLFMLAATWPNVCQQGKEKEENCEDIIVKLCGDIINCQSA